MPTSRGCFREITIARYIHGPATRRHASGVADVAATRQDDRIVSGGDPVNNSANIVWHFERVLRDGDVSRGVGRNACAYTSAYLRVAMATHSCRRAHRVPLGSSSLSWNRACRASPTIRCIPRRYSRHCSRVLF